LKVAQRLGNVKFKNGVKVHPQSTGHVIHGVLSPCLVCNWTYIRMAQLK